MKSSPGYTITEVVVAVGISGVLFAAFMSAFVTLQDSFSASYNYAVNTNDQQRVVDYICRDVRRSGTATVSGSGVNQSLTITIPDYYNGQYDSQGNPTGPIVTPTLNGSGQIVYAGTNGLANMLTVVYSLSGSSLLRAQTNLNSAGVQVSSTQVIGTAVSSFQMSFPDDSAGIVNFTIGFVPQYSLAASSGLKVNVSATVARRNVPQ